MWTSLIEVWPNTRPVKTKKQEKAAQKQVLRAGNMRSGNMAGTIPIPIGRCVSFIRRCRSCCRCRTNPVGGQEKTRRETHGGNGSVPSGNSIDENGKKQKMRSSTTAKSISIFE